MVSKFILVALSDDSSATSLDESALLETLGAVAGLELAPGSLFSAQPRALESEAAGPGYDAYLAQASFSGSLRELRQELAGISASLGVTVNAVPAELASEQKKLIIMDVDSTLIRQEVIDELATFAGRGAEVARITELAMQGELNFEESLRERVAQLKGVDESVLAEVASAVELTSGALELIRLAHEAGHLVAAVSGGFIQVLEPLAERIGLDFARANVLDIADGALTGLVEGGVVTPEVKKASLRQWAQESGVSLEQTVAIGDGANDILMLDEAAVGVAFCAKPKLRESADVQVNTLRLDAVRHFIGL